MPRRQQQSFAADADGQASPFNGVLEQYKFTRKKKVEDARALHDLSGDSLGCESGNFMLGDGSISSVRPRRKRGAEGGLDSMERASVVPGNGNAPGQALSAPNLANTNSEALDSPVLKKQRSAAQIVSRSGSSQAASRSSELKGRSSSVQSSSSSRNSSVARKSSSRKPSGYSSPEVYAHLGGVPDALTDGLYVMIVGTNPGKMSATTSHAYAHPSNRFWRYLFKSGLTSRLCRAEEDGNMPQLFKLGLTNIVDRATATGAELSKAEMRAGTLVLDEKAFRYKPRAVAVLGVSIWKEIFYNRNGRYPLKDEVDYGWQPSNMSFGRQEGYVGAPAFLLTSTSGLATHPSEDEKTRIWRELGDWVNGKRNKAEQIQEP